MATYEYSCDKCKNVEEHIHGMLEKPKIECAKCGNQMEIAISRNIGGFILKGGTPAIHSREKENRRRHSQEMARRQKERYGEPAKIRPNIAGHDVGTWANAYAVAQEIKKETGIIPETYAPLAAAEAKGKIITPI